MLKNLTLSLTGGLFVLGLFSLLAIGYHWSSRSVIVPVSHEEAYAQADLAAIAKLLSDSENGGHVSIPSENYGKNLNSDGFGKWLLDDASIDERVWRPLRLVLNKDGDWVDVGGEAVYLVFFGDKKNLENGEISKLARRYRAAAWSVGTNQINEFGGGDDIFMGLRRNGEWDTERYVSPWWKFWER